MSVNAGVSPLRRRGIRNVVLQDEAENSIDRTIDKMGTSILTSVRDS